VYVLKKGNSLENRIRKKQEKVNRYISLHGVGNSEELLELSRELDILILCWLKKKSISGKI
jgi:hypothetical protein